MRTILYSLLATILSILCVHTVESSTSRVPYYIYNAATAFNIDVGILYAICKVESKCRPTAINHNDGTSAQKEAGVVIKSYGIFQIKMATAKALGFRGSVTKLLRPEVNTWYAAKLLRQLYNKYKITTAALSAYNAGKPVSSNKNYVNKVLHQYVKYQVDGAL
jgi:soluble lytic murein transglycosylase-like protein